jgi:2-methylcitrate dehydratase PrpD
LHREHKLIEATTVATTEAQKLARFALELDVRQIPLDVLTLAKEHFLDALGIALASSTFDFGHSVLRAAQALGSGDDAAAIGSGQRLPAASAALVNGVLAHGLDFDDTHVGAIYHASAPALAAAWAAGQCRQSSGREVLTAFVVALEVGCRLAAVGAGAFHERAFHPTSLCGTFAGAAAAGRLCRLDEEKLVWALGLCGSMASGILERGNSWLKRLHPGWAAHSALCAVALADAGFTGPESVLEGRRGFYNAFVQRMPAGGDLPSVGLGQSWQCLGLALKPYPCCHFTHAFADAALSLRGQFALDEVERIDCLLTAGLHKMVAEPREICIRPQTPYQALFSTQYVTAVALVRGRVDLSTFYDEALDAPDVLALAARTEVLDDPDSDYPRHFPGEVVVYLKDGRVLRSRQATSLGTPERPLSRTAIEAKFMANATRAIAAEQAQRLVDAVMSLESAPSLDPIVDLCRS